MEVVNKTDILSTLNEGKTKVISAIANEPGLVLIQSKDRITAGDGARSNEMADKGEISTDTAVTMFTLLYEAGVKTHFINRQSPTSFLARRCHMIPIEFVTRRIATGSYLKRNVGVEEGYRFSPPKLEFFYKDDANHDPQWSGEQILAAKLDCAGVVIGPTELDIISKTTVAVFEILERSWAAVQCTLVDMKVEFGVDVETKEILLADIIDSDSWRLWPSGDKRLMKDKQVYRNLETVTPDALQVVKLNFLWTAEKAKELAPKSRSRVVVLMGSASDLETGKKIRESCGSLGVDCVIRVTSAHKGTDATLQIVADYEGDGIPTVIVAVAGRSNGLGPVVSGNSCLPVINCPPLGPDWGAQDVWSSLRLPSGLGCATVMLPDAAAQHAAQILGVTDTVIWSKLRAKQLNTWVDLLIADRKINEPMF